MYVQDVTRDIIINTALQNTSMMQKNYPNPLEQDFYPNIPSQKWAGDITYIYTKETGWTYLAIVMDLFDLKVVGWSYGLNMTENLVIEAFTKALINRGLNKDGIFHSDCRSQYTSNNFEQLLTDLNLKHSIVKKVVLMITQVWKVSMPY